MVLPGALGMGLSCRGLRAWVRAALVCVVLSLAVAAARPHRGSQLSAAAKHRLHTHARGLTEQAHGLHATPQTVGCSTLFSSRFYVVLEAPLGHNTKDEDHKRLWPLNARDVAGFLIAAAGLFIAAGGGLGGGGILVPVYILLLGARLAVCAPPCSGSWCMIQARVPRRAGFSTNIAVALSNITIVGGSIANFAFNVGKRHHFLDRPLIDWDLILVMEPATILGALVGGYLNRVRPLPIPIYHGRVTC